MGSPDEERQCHGMPGRPGDGLLPLSPDFSLDSQDVFF